MGWFVLLGGMGHIVTKGSKNQSSRFEPKFSLISFSRSSGPPLIDYAGRMTKFAPRKSLWFFELFLELSLFNFRFTVFFSVVCGLDSWRVSWSATRDSLLWWRATRGVVKCWEYGGKIRWKEFCPFHKNTGFTLTLLEKDPQNSNSEEISENRETFSWSKFSPATGVKNLKSRKAQFQKTAQILKTWH